MRIHDSLKPHKYSIGIHVSHLTFKVSSKIETKHKTKERRKMHFFHYWCRPADAKALSRFRHLQTIWGQRKVLGLFL